MLIPDHETAVDFLNFEAISSTVVQLLRGNRQRALTIGVHGDWGAGKSSVLKMIEAEVSKDERVACLWFNGWAFQGFDDAKTVLIEATISELCRKRSTFGKVKKLSSSLLKRVDGLKLVKRVGGLALALATGLPSLDQIYAFLRAFASAKTMSPEQAEAKITEAASFLKSAEDTNVPEEIHKFREEFSELLKEAQIEQLVVLIDDLDRCLPATAIDTLEAIRLFLFVPKTAFVIGADEAMIEYAVRQHFPNLPAASGPMSYARNYLEKLVQVPLRIPALGTQETKTYITLLLIESLVGEGHAGFATLLNKAKVSLNQPWLWSGLGDEDVRAVDAARGIELNATHVLAQRIGPILAKGTKGNPRQIKRFLNALLIRQAIARARGFGDSITQTMLAKLMLVEQFHTSFYDHLAEQAMIAHDGKVAYLAELENIGPQGSTTASAEHGKKKGGKEATSQLSPDAEKWHDDQWLQNWLRIEPKLGSTDLRPYVFVARDKRRIAAADAVGGLDALVEKLSSDSEMVVRSVQQAVKALSAPEAEQVFNSLKDRVLRPGTFTKMPPGFLGLGIVAQHHPRHQAEILALLAATDAKELGVWVVTGWNEIITDTTAKRELSVLLNRWSTQSDNAPLQKVASAALTSRSAGAR